MGIVVVRQSQAGASNNSWQHFNTIFTLALYYMAWTICLGGVGYVLIQKMTACVCDCYAKKQIQLARMLLFSLLGHTVIAWNRIFNAIRSPCCEAFTVDTNSDT